VQRRDLAAQIATALVGLGGSAVIAAMALIDSAPYRLILVLAGSLGMLGGVLGWIWLWLTGAPKSAPPPASELEAQPPAPVPIMHPPAPESHAEPGFVGPSITTAYLREIYRDRTHIQADKLAATFVGKRIEVSGAVTFVTALTDTQTSISIKMDQDTQGFESAWMLFPDDREQLEMLRAGDRITVTGKIRRFDQDEIQLVDCRLATGG
jgi:hypothetical protein